MAATLQAQWDAVYGPTPFETNAAMAKTDSVHFIQRVSVAAAAKAILVSQEPAGGPPPNHANRVALAKQVLQNPSLFAVPIALAMASQGMDQSSTDAAILNALNVGWDYIAGVP